MLARQLHLDLGHRPGLTLDDLVVARANQGAARLIESWPDWTSPVAVLVGPPGSGKTHILSIFASEYGATDAASDFAAAMRAAEAGEPIVWDDVDRGAIDETTLFHLINAVRSGRATLLLGARKSPANWGVALPDLASRLRAAALVSIEEPDEALLAAVITKLFADRQVEIEHPTVQYVVRHIERSLAAAMDAVDLLDKAALERRRPVTRALAAEILPKDSAAPD